MRQLLLGVFFATAIFLGSPALGQGAMGVGIWPDMAPGETSNATGDLQPFRENERPPVSRVINIRKPTLDIYPAKQPNGVGVLILPGGGFGKVVPDMEGSEAAVILNRIGISAFVLRYRTKKEATDLGWKRPLQDGAACDELVTFTIQRVRRQTRFDWSLGVLGRWASSRAPAHGSRKTSI